MFTTVHVKNQTVANIHGKDKLSPLKLSFNPYLENSCIKIKIKAAYFEKLKILFSFYKNVCFFYPYLLS
jgi:hypothetical protein